VLAVELPVGLLGGLLAGVLVGCSAGKLPPCACGAGAVGPRCCVCPTVAVAYCSLSGCPCPALLLPSGWSPVCPPASLLLVLLVSCPLLSWVAASCALTAAALSLSGDMYPGLEAVRVLGLLTDAIPLSCLSCPSPSNVALAIRVGVPFAPRLPVLSCPKTNLPDKVVFALVPEAIVAPCVPLQCSLFPLWLPVDELVVA